MQARHRREVPALASLEPLRVAARYALDLDLGIAVSFEMKAMRVPSGDQRG